MVLRRVPIRLARICIPTSIRRGHRFNVTLAEKAGTPQSEIAGVTVHSPDTATPKPNIRDLQRIYREILVNRQKSRNNDFPAPTILTEHQFIAVLDSLGSYGQADISAITDVASHLPAVFGMDLTMDIHDAVLRALIRNDHILAARNWLQSMSQKSGHHLPKRSQWHMFLTSAMTSETFKFLHNSVKQMRPSGCKPNADTYQILIEARWATYKESYPHVIVFSTLVDEMKQEGLPYASSIENLLYRNYAERGFIPAGVEIAKYYRSIFPKMSTSAEEQERRWKDWLSDAARKDGVRGAVTLYKKLEADGCIGNSSILTAMLKFSRNVSDIRYLEKTFDIVAGVELWSVVINNLARSGLVSEALAVYAGFKKSGMKPDAALVGPLIRALCRTTIRPPTDAQIDEALRLYHDLAEAVPISEHVPRPTDSYDHHSIGPDVDIYRNLLRAIAASPNSTKFFPVANDLLNDMASRRLLLHDSMVTASVIILLMRSSNNVDEAFGHYKRLCSGLDVKGYAVVLSAFSKIPFSADGHLPALHQYFDMVRDMRDAGHTMTTEVYTILLHQFAIVGTRMNEANSDIPDELRPTLISAVRRAHDLLTLDASLSPDTLVLNQLMDTYQRLKCFGDAYRVWDTMYLSRQFDSVSVSIILDACGWAGAWDTAKQVCMRLSRDNYRFNQHNWNTWIECLCRLGKLDDAVKTVCLEMGREQNDVAPDVDSVRIVVKFARKANQHELVLSRIKRYLPELWEELPYELRTA